MPVCPFMSRPVSVNSAPNTYGPTSKEALIECQREDCAAWGPVEPFWIMNHEDSENREYYVRLVGNEWKRIPKDRNIDTTVCGCRRIGGEVRE